MTNPWFQPLYRRVLTVAACLIWLGFELWTGEVLWLLLAALFSGYAIWDLLLSGKYSVSRDDAGG